MQIDITREEASIVISALLKHAQFLKHVEMLLLQNGIEEHILIARLKLKVSALEQKIYRQINNQV